MAIEETASGFKLALSGKEFNLLSQETLTISDTDNYNLVCGVDPKIPPLRDVYADIGSLVTARKELEAIGGLSKSLIAELDAMKRKLERELPEYD